MYVLRSAMSGFFNNPYEVHSSSLRRPHFGFLFVCFPLPPSPHSYPCFVLVEFPCSAVSRSLLVLEMSCIRVPEGAVESW